MTLVAAVLFTGPAAADVGSGGSASLDLTMFSQGDEGGQPEKAEGLDYYGTRVAARVRVSDEVELHAAATVALLVNDDVLPPPRTVRGATVTSASTTTVTLDATTGVVVRPGGTSAALSVGLYYHHQFGYIAGGIDLGASQELFGGDTVVDAAFSVRAAWPKRRMWDGDYFGWSRQTTYNVSLGVTQNLSPSVVLGLGGQLTRQVGFLSEPFNFVVLDDLTGTPRAMVDEVTPALLLFAPGSSAPTARFRRVDAIPDAGPLEPVIDEGTELGTSYDVLVLARAGEADRARDDLQAARALVRSLGAQLSEWSADSEVSGVNQRAAQAPVTLSPTLRRLIAGALHVTAMTGGAFDITWPPLGDLWDEAARTGQPPSEAALAVALQSVGAGALVLEGDALRFGAPGTRIGLGGVAKGAIVDAAFLLLGERGHAHIVVNIGGDLRTCGRDERGAPRSFQLVDPYRPDVIAGTIEVADTSIATSGNYLRFRSVGGARVGHILDPRTGQPPAFDGSVTVLTRDAAMADALATALFVTGPDEGLAFSRSVAGLDAIYVTRDGVRATVPVDVAD